MKQLYTFILILAAGIFVSSCAEDFLETKSTSAVDQLEMFTTTDNAMLALNGIHRKMYTGGSYAPRSGWGSYMQWMDFLGEDLVYTKGNAQWKGAVKWDTHRSATNSFMAWQYGVFYDIIVNANFIIENIDNAEGPQEDKDHIKGQAMAYRAFSHFYLVQPWGKRYEAGKENKQDGIVLKLSTSLENQPRSSVEDVYKSINSDLDSAIMLLDRISIKRPDITHINVHVARSLKARVLLTQGRWLEAAKMAEEVINKSGAKLQANTYDYKQGRMCDASNTEWIWAKIGYPELETGTLINFFSYISNTNVSYNRNTPRAIYNLLYDKISDTDVRKSIWLPDAPLMDKTDIAIPPNGNIFKWMSQKFIVDSPYWNTASYAGNLYTADLAYIRLPEIMLIAAEAYARAGEYTLAADALYPLAKIRDPQYEKSTKTGEELIEEIMIQRRVELWGEGFRFLDLKRLNLPLDRGPKPREGYNQGGAKNNWKNGKNPTNLDPEASNYNMYDDQPFGETYRYIEASDKRWEFLIPKTELDRNPLATQNPV